ncbi:Uncharacterised protein [Yersinia enterocolitica]|nr:Uncharacterised protein [Yersinia enterocolitica]
MNLNDIWQILLLGAIIFSRWAIWPAAGFRGGGRKNSIYSYPRAI